jgi:hypothetical protein
MLNEGELLGVLAELQAMAAQDAAIASVAGAVSKVGAAIAIVLAPTPAYCKEGQFTRFMLIWRSILAGERNDTGYWGCTNGS